MQAMKAAFNCSMPFVAQMDNIQFYTGPSMSGPAPAVASKTALDKSQWSDLYAVLAEAEKGGWLESPSEPLDNAHGLSLATPDSRSLRGPSPYNLEDEVPVTPFDATLSCSRASIRQHMQNQLPRQANAAVRDPVLSCNLLNRLQAVDNGPLNQTASHTGRAERRRALSATAYSEDGFITETGLSRMSEGPIGTNNAFPLVAAAPEGVRSSDTDIGGLGQTIEDSVTSTPHFSIRESVERELCSNGEDDSPRVPGRRYGSRSRSRRDASQPLPSSESGIGCGAVAQHDSTDYRQNATMTRSSTATSTSSPSPLQIDHDTSPSNVDQPRWCVDCIVKSAKFRGKTHFRVRWEDTWEPAEALRGTAEDAIQDFFATSLLHKVGNHVINGTASIKKRSQKPRQPTRKSSLVTESRGRKRGAAPNRRV